MLSQKHDRHDTETKVSIELMTVLHPFHLDSRTRNIVNGIERTPAVSDRETMILYVLDMHKEVIKKVLVRTSP